MKSKEVFHLWANKSRERAKAGNVSFEGPKAFSYARCIAMIHERGGRTLVLFGTVGRNSSSTSKHQSYAGGAASHLPSASVPNYAPRDKSDHLDNLKAILGDYNANIGRAERARTHGDFWRKEALRCAEAYNTYAEFFGLKERFDEGSAARLAKQVKAEEAAREKKRKDEEARRVERMKERLALWREGGDQDLWGLPFIALRLGFIRAGEFGGYNDVVQTSRSAEIPIADAKRLWPLIQRAKRGDREYEVGMELGGYQLTKIRRDGSIIVGCHDIPYAEIEGIAKKLGLAEEVAA